MTKQDQDALRILDIETVGEDSYRSAEADAALAHIKAALEEREKQEYLHKLDHSLADQWQARAEKAEAELERAKSVILQAHDELAGETWECPHCGHSEPTSDMDVMELVLKPAALAYKEGKK